MTFSIVYFEAGIFDDASCFSFCLSLALSVLKARPHLSGFLSGVINVSLCSHSFFSPLYGYAVNFLNLLLGKNNTTGNLNMAANGADFINFLIKLGKLRGFMYSALRQEYNITCHFVIVN